MSATRWPATQCPGAVVRRVIGVVNKDEITADVAARLVAAQFPQLAGRSALAAATARPCVPSWATFRLQVLSQAVDLGFRGS
jgi:hypothetical protein